MFLQVLTAPAARTTQITGDVDDTDDTGGTAIYSLTDPDPDDDTETSSDALDGTRHSHGDVDAATGEPLFVRGNDPADITAPDTDLPTPSRPKDRPMASCAGIIGGLAPRGLTLLELIRMRDPRAKTIVPAYC